MPPPGRRASRPASTRCCTSALEGQGRDAAAEAAATSATSRSRRAVVYMAQQGGRQVRRAGTAGASRRRRRDRATGSAADAGAGAAPRPRAPVATRRRQQPHARAALDARSATRRGLTRQAQIRPPRTTPAARGDGRAAAAAARGAAALRARSARPATSPASPARRSSATRPPGRRAWRRASTG